MNDGMAIWKLLEDNKSAIKQLTPDEFHDLGQGPHDATVVGVPPDGMEYRAEVWMENVHGWECCFSHKSKWIYFRVDVSESYARYPIWHKLPRPFVED